MKDKQHSGEKGRPKDVEILGGSGNAPSGDSVRIVGAAPRHGTVEILDRSQGEPPQPIEMRVHTENVVEGDKLRSKPPQEGDPQVRVRNMTKEQQEEWQRVKEGRDE